MCNLVVVDYCIGGSADLSVAAVTGLRTRRKRFMGKLNLEVRNRPGIIKFHAFSWSAQLEGSQLLKQMTVSSADRRSVLSTRLSDATCAQALVRFTALHETDDLRADDK